MKITLDIPDGIIAGFFNGVEVTAHGMQLVSYQLSTDDLKDGNTVKLPREQEVTAMMKPEYCPDYVGVACVDGTCPVANCEEYAERCMPVISCCRDCFYYKGCEDCAISDDCDRMEDKHE